MFCKDSSSEHNNSNNSKIAIGINLAMSTIALITAAPSTPRITSAVKDQETTETTMTDKRSKNRLH